ncbi:type III secretion system chaperone [Achromobacter xylosoxidans]
MDAHTLVSLLGDRAGIPLSLSEAGTLALLFENDVILNLEHAASEDALHLYVIVGGDPYDDEERLALYGDMLEANLFCHDTGGGSLGLDDATGEILLTRRVELAMAHVGHLSEAIETLVAAAIQWKSKIADAAISDDAVALADPSEPLPFNMRA